RHRLHRQSGFDPRASASSRCRLFAQRLARGGADLRPCSGFRRGRPDARRSRRDDLMAIAVKLDDLLHDRRMTLTELAEKIDITLANLSILKTGKARAIRFSTLEAICAVLKCQPGDLLEFHSDSTPERRPSVSLDEIGDLK